MSARPHRTTRLSLDGFLWNLIFDDFRKSVEKIQVSLKSEKNEGYLTYRPIYNFYHFMFEFPCIISLYYIKNQQDATLAVLFINNCKITDAVTNKQYCQSCILLVPYIIYNFIISRPFLLRMRNVSYKSFGENQNTHFMFNDIFSKIVPFEIMWKNMVERGRP